MKFNNLKDLKKYDVHGQNTIRKAFWIWNYYALSRGRPEYVWTGAEILKHRIQFCHERSGGCLTITDGVCRRQADWCIRFHIFPSRQHLIKGLTNLRSVLAHTYLYLAPYGLGEPLKQVKIFYI